MKRNRVAFVLGVVLCLSEPAWPGDLYSCVTRKGDRISRDRPIAECSDVEQVVRRGNGRIDRVPPLETEDERGARLAKEEAALADAQRVRREAMANRMLMTRFPNEAAHEVKRAGSLASPTSAIRVAMARIKELETDRVRLMRKREFFPPPFKEPASLTATIDANEAALAAQRAILLYQQAEAGRITAMLDDELGKLKVLWAAQAKSNPVR